MGGIRTKFYVDIMAFHPEVTGSCNLVIVKYPNGTSTKFVVDCGLFQERKYAEYNRVLPFDADTLDFVLVTHNHVDHVGRLPLLIKEKYEGNIYMTNVTSKLIKLALYDSYKVLKSTSKRDNEKLLYSEADVENCLKQIVGCEIENTIQINENIKVTFLSNGHLLGSAMILVQISNEGYEDINLLFTGDYNNNNMFFDVKPITKFIKDLSLTIIQESTYGYMDSTEITECFEKNILAAAEEKKTIIVPVFSLGRAQEILYILKELQEKKKLSSYIPIYFDGKLANKYTQIYLKEEVGIKESMKDFLPNNYNEVSDKFRHDLLEDTNAKIIVTTSGMGSYGPAQTYIPEYLSRGAALIHFTGYAAEGTLGNRLKNAPIGEPVNIAGLIVIKRADVQYTNEFSAHAKADEMIRFLKDIAEVATIKMILVNHGSTSMVFENSVIDVKEIFAKRILKEVDTKHVGILGREYFFRIDPYGLVKTMNTKFK